MNVKKLGSLLVSLVVISCCSGYLMSKASWIGRVGMTFFYKEYNFLKIWWQGAIAVFLIYLFFLLFHLSVYAKIKIALGRLIHVMSCLTAMAGMYASYNDFHTDISHKLLRHRFHDGVYIFWTGWMIISIFFLFLRKPEITDVDKNPSATV